MIQAHIMHSISLFEIRVYHRSMARYAIAENAFPGVPIIACICLLRLFWTATSGRKGLTLARALPRSKRSSYRYLAPIETPDKWNAATIKGFPYSSAVTSSQLPLHNCRWPILKKPQSTISYLLVVRNKRYLCQHSSQIDNVSQGELQLVSLQVVSQQRILRWRSL
jgi:hypothetical protein